MARRIDELPPTPPSQTKEMKVIILSAPRSGSSSMAAALKRLSYTPFAGMAHNYFVSNCFPLWDEAINAAYNNKGSRFTKDDFEKFLGPYDSVGGWGAAILAEDLVKEYPDAKFILTTRDPDAWIKSWSETIVHTQSFWRRWNWMLPICRGLERDFRIDAGISFHAWCYGDPFDMVQQKQFYIDHNEKVRRLVPKDRLLDLPTSGNWDELCKFLGEPVPKEPFPHTSTRGQHAAAMNFIWKKCLYKTMRRLGAVAAFGGAVWFVVDRYWGWQNVLRRIQLK